MHPQFNSHPYNNNGTKNSAPQQQQVMGNPGNFCPNPMEIRPQFQMGMLPNNNNNPQLGMPQFNNLNPFFTPAQFFPFQQNPMNNNNNLNPNNMSQFFAPNPVNPQFLPNGQLNMPNLVQNVSNLLQLQMQMQMQAQMQNCGLPNPGMFMNGQPGMGNGNGNGVVQQSVNGVGSNFVKPNGVVTKDFGSPQATDNGAAKSQNNAGVVNGTNDRNNSWKKSHNKNFDGNPKSHRGGFGKRQFNNRQNGQRGFNLNSENRGKGNINIGVKESNLNEQDQVGKKRLFALNYSDKEIEQWRAERRKNHPSNANKENKKLSENPTQPEVTDEAAKIRRQQLKEILAKQAELGCEVAEIPSSYLLDTEQHTDGRQQNNEWHADGRQNNRAYGRRGRFQSRGRFNQNDRFSQRRGRGPNNESSNFQGQNDRFTKKQRLSNDYNTNNMPEDNIKREPSLLKKLLSSDMKRDKKYLLQVFRFMVMNSFFEDGPEKPLKFPKVIVKESDGSETIEEISEMLKDDSFDGEADIADGNEASCSSRANVVKDESEKQLLEEEEEEDGEIMD